MWVLSLDIEVASSMFDKCSEYFAVTQFYISMATGHEFQCTCTFNFNSSKLTLTPSYYLVHASAMGK